MAGKYDIIYDELCFEEEDDGSGPKSPYPLEALYTLEGLSYIEVVQIQRAICRGEDPPDWRELEGAQRRDMARALGATEDGADHKLASAAGKALDQVRTAAKRVGVTLQLSGPRAELLSVTTALVTSGVWEGHLGEAVKRARQLIDAVDRDLAQAHGRG
jgi:hypothetical protein